MYKRFFPNLPSKNRGNTAQSRIIFKEISQEAFDYRRIKIGDALVFKMENSLHFIYKKEHYNESNSLVYHSEYVPKTNSWQHFSERFCNDYREMYLEEIAEMHHLVKNSNSELLTETALTNFTKNIEERYKHTPQVLLAP
jgi:hypothetical protein